MKCEQSGCEAEAVAVSHFNGKDLNQCEDHCRAINNLSQHMGWSKMVFTDLNTGLSMEFKPKED